MKKLLFVLLFSLFATAATLTITEPDSSQQRSPDGQLDLGFKISSESGRMTFNCEYKLDNRNEPRSLGAVDFIPPTAMQGAFEEEYFFVDGIVGLEDGTRTLLVRCEQQTSIIDDLASLLTGASKEILEDSVTFFYVRAEAVQCADSDNGINEFEKGTCIDESEHEDSCANDGYALTEWYCAAAGSCVSKPVECLNKCVDGACNKPPYTKCVDVELGGEGEPFVSSKVLNSKTVTLQAGQSTEFKGVIIETQLVSAGDVTIQLSQDGESFASTQPIALGESYLVGNVRITYNAYKNGVPQLLLEELAVEAASGKVIRELCITINEPLEGGKYESPVELEFRLHTPPLSASAKQLKKASFTSCNCLVTGTYELGRCCVDIECDDRLWGNLQACQECEDEDDDVTIKEVCSDALGDQRNDYPDACVVVGGTSVKQWSCSAGKCKSTISPCPDGRTCVDGACVSGDGDGYIPECSECSADEECVSTQTDGDCYPCDCGDASKAIGVKNYCCPNVEGPQLPALYNCYYSLDGKDYVEVGTAALLNGAALTDSLELADGSHSASVYCVEVPSAVSPGEGNLVNITSDAIAFTVGLSGVEPDYRNFVVEIAAPEQGAEYWSDDVDALFRIVYPIGVSSNGEYIVSEPSNLTNEPVQSFYDCRGYLDSVSFDIESAQAVGIPDWEWIAGTLTPAYYGEHWFIIECTRKDDGVVRHSQTVHFTTFEPNKPVIIEPHWKPEGEGYWANELELKFKVGGDYPFYKCMRTLDDSTEAIKIEDYEGGSPVLWSGEKALKNPAKTLRVGESMTEGGYTLTLYKVFSTMEETSLVPATALVPVLINSLGGGVQEVWWAQFTVTKGDYEDLTPPIPEGGYYEVKDSDHVYEVFVESISVGDLTNLNSDATSVKVVFEVTPTGDDLLTDFIPAGVEVIAYEPLEVAAGSHELFVSCEGWRPTVSVEGVEEVSSDVLEFTSYEPDKPIILLPVDGAQYSFDPNCEDARLVDASFLVGGTHDYYECRYELDGKTIVFPGQIEGALDPDFDFEVTAGMHYLNVSCHRGGSNRFDDFVYSDLVSFTVVEAPSELRGVTVNFPINGGTYTVSTLDLRFTIDGNFNSYSCRRELDSVWGSPRTVTGQSASWPGDLTGLTDGGHSARVECTGYCGEELSSETAASSVTSFTVDLDGSGGYCGDGVCGAGESCSNCPSDCGSCGGGGSDVPSGGSDYAPYGGTWSHLAGDKTDSRPTPTPSPMPTKKPTATPKASDYAVLTLKCPSKIDSNRTTAQALLTVNGAPTCDNSAQVTLLLNGAPTKAELVSCADGKHKVAFDSLEVGEYELKVSARGASDSCRFRGGVLVEEAPALPLLFALAVFGLAWYAYKKKAR